MTTVGVKGLTPLTGTRQYSMNTQHSQEGISAMSYARSLDPMPKTENNSDEYVTQFSPPEMSSMLTCDVYTAAYQRNECTGSDMIL